MPKTVTKPLNREIHQNQRILFAGRIVPDKGLDWLLKALAQTELQIHLDIAGDGWDLPRMQKLARQLRLNDRIAWHGWCSSEQLETLYHNCFALIFPSLWPEPAGIITLEAYAHYRPVIASAVGGIPEHLRHGETGFLIPANDIAKLAAAINQLSGDYQKSKYFGQQGHDWLMEAFTMEFHLKGLQQIYQQAIENFQSQNCNSSKFSLSI
jgi:glycosyltransferase involved in cell wall biosynthesis